MLSIKEIEKLAALSRIKLTDAEKDKFQKEIESILSYVNQIKEVSAKLPEAPLPETRNVFRDDRDALLSGEFTDSILKNAPQSEAGYLKVKKILT
ncbi:MAG TPA: Asp-tRNA(Asn)/Glu-tRNA(Gln) amidotransferase subunit GatC [Candidatus Paceibacterota bacterium]